MNEEWVVYPIQRYEGSHWGDQYAKVFLLVGFHPLTKEKLHEYGPFDSISSLTVWAKEHGVDLKLKY